MVMIALRFDLRRPPFASPSHAELYAACLDQCVWADEIGADVVVLSEHHGVEDGFLSAPLTLAAAIVARTKRLRVNVAAALLPLHDPIRFAEQLAALHLISHGRVSIVAGLGYRQEEFDMAGVRREDRAKLLEESVAVMRQAWTGEPFEWRGRMVRVTPKPESPPAVFVGGSTPMAARRAARLRCGFFPAIADPKLTEIYETECVRLDFRGGFVRMPTNRGFVHVSDNPQRDWPRIAPHALYDAQSYASWQTPDQRSGVHVTASTEEDVRTSGVYQVITPDECVRLADTTGSVILHPLMGGMSPDLGWEGLRLFEREVLPRIRQSIVDSR
jgi:alkanesulfonate monooxygenase SsuD/methylene tetrahydromethanopterin reductase-like flavin-dependent oxidoreductase (luciferase family)